MRHLRCAALLLLFHLLPWDAVGQSSYASTSSATAPVLPTPTYTMCGTVPALVVLYDYNSGAEIVGTLIQLLATLQGALCPTSVDGFLADCDAYESNRLQLYQLYGSQLCGFPDGSWNTTGKVQVMTPDQALEFLLGQCTTTYQGNLTTVTLSAVAQFTSVSTSSRSDVAAVIAANVAAHGGNSSNVAYPSLIPNLAPLPAAGRQPAVLTAGLPAAPYEYVPSNPSVASPGGAHSSEYLPVGLGTTNPVFPELGHPDATVQYPSTLSAVALSGTLGSSMYASHYLAHPSLAARFISTYCSTQPWNDDTCFPTVTPQIGVTHDEYGNRLESDRGQALVAGTPDIAGVPQTRVVPPGAFSAQTPYTIANG